MEEEKEAIKLLKKDSTDYYYRSIDVRNAVRVALNYIEKLQKELEEKTTILMAGADKVKQLEKENQELKEDNSHQWEERCRLTFELEKLQKENAELKEKNIILEGNKIGYKLAIQELKDELQYYKDKENQDFDERDYYEE